MRQILTVVFAILAFGCADPSGRLSENPSALDSLDEEVRGSYPSGLSDEFLHDRCLRVLAGELRSAALFFTGPEDFIRFYPSWVQSLDDCLTLYPVETDRALQLKKEALRMRAREAIGEITQDYLFIQPFDSGEEDTPDPEKLDMWRTFAIVTLAEIDDVLDSEEGRE
jgi:hypothetical protein